MEVAPAEEAFDAAKEDWIQSAWRTLINQIPAKWNIVPFIREILALLSFVAMIASEGCDRGEGLHLLR